jgi:hypothetical protein
VSAYLSLQIKEDASRQGMRLPITAYTDVDPPPHHPVYLRQDLRRGREGCVKHPQPLTPPESCRPRNVAQLAAAKLANFMEDKRRM